VIHSDPYRKEVNTMAEETIGNFREMDEEICSTLKDIMAQGKDAEIRKRRDGTYDVFELDRKKRKPSGKQKGTK